MDYVCGIFEQHRGAVQGLQEQAGAFAAMLTAFCERIGWMDLHALLGKFQQRVAFGVKAEIAELTEIPFVKVHLLLLPDSPHASGGCFRSRSHSWLPVTSWFVE